jgi:hypothetical protein
MRPQPGKENNIMGSADLGFDTLCVVVGGCGCVLFVTTILGTTNV